MKKRKLTKKNLIIRSTIMLVIIVSAIIGIFTVLNKKKTLKTEMSTELQRTQVYEDVKDGDNAITDVDGNSLNAVKFDAFFLKDKNGDGIAESIRGTCN